MSSFQPEIEDRDAFESEIVKQTNNLHATHHIIDMLERSKLSTEALLECFPEVLFVIDEKGRILKANKKAEVLLNVESGESLFKSICELFGEENCRVLLDICKKITDQETGEKDISIKRQGHIRHYHFSVKLVPDISERRGRLYFLVGHEITEIKNLLDEISAKNKKLSSYNEELEGLVETINVQRTRLTESARLSQIGEMAGGIVHEINNPIAVIKGFADFIKSGIENKTMPEEKVIAKLEKISTTVDRVTKIIQGMKGLARDSSEDPLELMPLKDILESTVTFTREKFTIEQVSFDFTYPDDSVKINCRPTQISQVLINLLNNAIDAVGDLEEKWVKIEIIAENDQVIIQVTDSGQGIPDEVKKKIFQPFFSTKPVGKGTGLGLSISATILKHHNGKLEIDKNCPNTRFKLIFPAA